MATTVIIDIQGHTFPKVSVPKGTSVVWRNQDPSVHSAEMDPNAEPYFTAGAMRQGEMSSPVCFAATGTYPYFCRYHAGMTGTIVVTDGSTIDIDEPNSNPSTPAIPAYGPMGGHMDHDHHGGGTGSTPGDNPNPLLHYHGFVTGGRSGKKLYMTHTPVIADPRHCYQVILRAHFVEEEHARLYEALRDPDDLGDGLVQIFHAHMSMPDLAAGTISELPHASVNSYPHGLDGGEVEVPGLQDVPIRIDSVLHAHQFQPDEPYPDGLEYLVYGDEDDVFIDHLIGGAPNFHSVAKLAVKPDFWTGEEGVMQISVPSKKIRNLEPRVLPRIAQVDNSFHIVWLPPPGLTRRPADPLRSRTGEAVTRQILTPDGAEHSIEIFASGFLYLDVGLLNYGVIIS